MPLWVAEKLGLPGAVSFRRMRKVVVHSADHAESYRRAPDIVLADHARRFQDASPADGEMSPQLLALVAENAKRSLGYVPFEEQLLASAALFDGYAVEMDTGEGKTLVGAMAAACHALSGRRVHVLSVNDYLARRDSEWMTPFFDALRVNVAWVGQASTAAERRHAYRAQVVYASVSEVGYDVLRDRQARDVDERVALVSRRLDPRGRQAVGDG